MQKADKPQLAELIKRTSEERGLSAGALANRVGVSERTVRRWHKGTRPQLHQLRRLAEELGLPFDHLRSAAEGTPPAEPSRHPEEKAPGTSVEHQPPGETVQPLAEAPDAGKQATLSGVEDHLPREENEPGVEGPGPSAQAPHSSTGQSPPGAKEGEPVTETFAPNTSSVQANEPTQPEPPVEPPPTGQGKSRRLAWLAVIVAALTATAVLNADLWGDGGAGSGNSGSDRSPSPPVTASAGPTGTTASPPPPDQAARALLGRDIEPDDEKPCGLAALAAGVSWLFQDVSIDGTRYEAAYTCAMLSGASGSLYFTLGKQYRSLDVVAGFPDGTVPTVHRVKFEFIQDGRLYLTAPFELVHGDTHAVRLNVEQTSKLEIRLTETAVPGGNERPASPVVASLKLN